MSKEHWDVVLLNADVAFLVAIMGKTAHYVINKAVASLKKIASN